MAEMVLIFMNWRYHRIGNVVNGKQYTACGKRANRAPWKRILRTKADASGWTPCRGCYRRAIDVDAAR